MGLVGLCVGGVDAALALGGLVAAMAWTVGFVTWLSILREGYAASAAAMVQKTQVPEEIQPEAEPYLGVDRYTARNEDGSRQLILKPPCEASQLHQFAMGMVHELPTTVEYWTVKTKEFSRDEFTNFRNWLTGQNFAKLVEGNKLLMTPDGLEMCEWVCYRGLQRMVE
jgi:hypothetical protein